MGTSHQKGWVLLRGKKWYGYFRRTVIDPETNNPKRLSSPIVLGLKIANDQISGPRKAGTGDR